MKILVFTTASNGNTNTTSFSTCIACIIVVEALVIKFGSYWGFSPWIIKRNIRSYSVSIQKTIEKSNIYQAKKVRVIGTFTKWTADQKVSAIKELVSNIPTSVIKDESK